MIKYRVKFVNLVTGYSQLQTYYTISEATEVAKNLMEICEEPFRITITTKKK